MNAARGLITRLPGCAFKRLRCGRAELASGHIGGGCVIAAAWAELEPGLPFRQSIAVLVVYPIGMERLVYLNSCRISCDL